MLKDIISVSIFLILSTVLSSQIQINESMEFQTDPSKDYSIVVPSSYVEGEPIAAFLALHPFNTARWNGETWCEELAEFAEANDVILVCPDGGADGKIDDPIDTSFTSFLLDSAFQWYDIDPTKLYAIGFSWGGKTTYTYGLNHIDKFAGLLPIGAAISASEVNGISQNIEGKPVYVVHGSLDTPNSRFFPLVEAMESNGACVETNLLQGVGHTIDFDNQLEILTDAYTYLKNNNCTTTSTSQILKESNNILRHNAIKIGESIDISIEGRKWTIYSVDGRVMKTGSSSSIVMDLISGYYIIEVDSETQRFKIY